MSLNQIRTKYPPIMGLKRYACHLCGKKATEVEIKFKGGTVAPVIGETLTCNTQTGIVSVIELLSGAWDGTATGYITMTSPTGIDTDGHWGVDAGYVSGSLGAILSLDGEGTKKVQGISYPESDMVNIDGTWLCRWHYDFRYRPKRRDEQKFDMEEGDI
jgi:hypothetical protein